MFVEMYLYLTGIWKWIERGKDQDASRMEGTCITCIPRL